MAVPRVNLRLVDSNREADLLSLSQREYVEQLYGRYRGDLHGYIARLLPSGAGDIESILQETYVRLLRQDSLDKLSDNARAYIYTTATNLVRDSVRRHVRQKGDWHEPLDETAHPVDEHSPQHGAQWQQSLERIRMALAALKPVTRDVFILSRFHEYSYPEIAERLSLSTRSIERHMSKALSHLRKTLDDLL
ncbi:RNA polymerase sigma factor [Gilvimarinus algae]|uniref:RNA polymerase sigma factor n=1 Tax=Gilvimarinus algae TaxID=3058037 RepID=A0ABT8THN7_9GAMM|nr:RNA polymerase sigma factor [Gilvimarinus sp. SDUM040014]MDO3382196.1 RNA polymerase sigma factor [Gilvimarinus sp. SDUM040014]